jgi:hypothetical protein
MRTGTRQAQQNVVIVEITEIVSQVRSIRRLAVIRIMPRFLHHAENDLSDATQLAIPR